MAKKIVLFISSAQIVAAHMHRGKIAQCEILSPDEQGLARFGGMLQAARSAETYLVVDTVEEDYRFETLPHATGADRRSMLDRKVRQFYRSTRFVSTLLRERVGDKRRDDRYLFAALTNPALVEPWLATIAEYGSPVAGVFLAPVVTAGLLPKLGISDRRLLIAAPHRSGLRLTFFKDGEFCSSRLTRIVPRDLDDAAQMLVTELSNTRLYLSTLHLDSIDEPLKVIFLDREDQVAEVVSRISADGHGLECSCISRSTLMRQLKITPQHLDLALETIYPGLVTERPLAANLAPAPVTAGYYLQQRKRTLYEVSAIMGMVGLMWTSYNLWHAADMADQATDAARRTAGALEQYKEITRTFPAAPTTSENLIKAVNTYQQIIKTVRSPRPFLNIISRAIEPSPEIFLQEITWNYGNEQPDFENTSASTPAGAPQITATHAEGRRQSGILAGEIRPFQGDYRAAIASINRVAERLARDPAVADVRVVKLPLNVNPELSLRGDTRDTLDHSGTADFRILLTLKPSA